MLKIILLIISAFVVFGCTTTHLIKSGEDFSLEERAKLVLKNNQNIGVNKFYTTADSIVVNTIRTRQEQRLHKSEMRELIVTHRGKGALHGGLILGVGGALVSYAYLKLAAKDNEGSITKEGTALIYGIWGGALGAVGGTLIGKKDKYIFESDKHSDAK